MEYASQAVTSETRPHIRAVGGPTQIYLVRHGTTTMNAANRYRGRRDIPLDSQGYQDAVDAARFLSGMGLAAVYTGPLRRTTATAQIIADPAGIPDIRILHGLNNVDYGAWEGMTSEEAAMYDPTAFGRYRQSPLDCVCPNGERLAAAQERIVEAITLIGARHQGELVAAVSHAVVIRLFLLSLGVIADEDWRMPIGRGSIIEVAIDNDTDLTTARVVFKGSADSDAGKGHDTDPRVASLR
jgi:broad specificity phosphatase PhoE